MWSKDNKSIFYVTKDDLDRPHKAGLPQQHTLYGILQQCTFMSPCNHAICPVKQYEAASSQNWQHPLGMLSEVNMLTFMGHSAFSMSAYLHSCIDHT